MNKSEVANALGLTPHPEGGFFKEIYRSVENIAQEHLPNRYKSNRDFSTSIYYLLGDNDFSAMHILESDEIFHFYSGRPVKLFMIKPDGESETVTLGSDLVSGQVPQALVPRGVWQGLYPVTDDYANCSSLPNYSLLGTTVAPGFDFVDFRLGGRNELLAEFPQHAETISRLTRD